MVKLTENELYDVICSIEYFKGKIPMIVKSIEDLNINCALLMKELNGLKENDSNSKIIIEQLQKNIDEMNKKIEIISEICNKNSDYNNSIENKIQSILFILSIVFSLYMAGVISLKII